MAGNIAGAATAHTCHVPAQTTVETHYSAIPMPRNRPISGNSPNLWHITTYNFMGIVNPHGYYVYELLFIIDIMRRLCLQVAKNMAAIENRQQTSGITL